MPGDKSVSHRAAIFGALATGTTRITNFLDADDTAATLDCLRQLGAQITRSEARTVLTVEGTGSQGLQAPLEPLFCGNSGTTIRLLSGVLAGFPFESTLTGDASLSRRPMDRVQLPLEQMGAQVKGQGTRCTPPLHIRGGNLQGITYSLPVASAQVKSAILLAGLQASGRTTVIEPSPARDHTERMLRAFGAPVAQDDSAVSIEGGAWLQAVDVEVPGDISSAAFFFALAALRPGWSLTVREVGINPTRTGVLDVLGAMGATIHIDNQRESGGEPLADASITGGELSGVEISGALIPRLIDELPVLALVATQAQGRTIIRDAKEMRVKESDRIAVISGELRKLGANIEEQPDGMIIDGPTPLRGTMVSSPPGDHRIAMTLAVAAMVAAGETVIENAQAINSSFPSFPALLEQVRI